MARIGAISTFIKALKNIKAKDGHTLYFRGHADESWLAHPSIYRHVNNDVNLPKYVSKEDVLFRSMVANCPEDFLHCESAFDYLVKMQHYGLPTRLLDVTSNPLVALYFACNSLNGKDGKHAEVLVYEVPDEEIRFYNSDTVSVISNISKVSVGFDFQNQRTKFIHEIKNEKPYFLNEIKEEHFNSVVCVKAKLDNKRIVKQSGAFLLFAMGKDKLNPAEIPDKYLYQYNKGQSELKITQNGKQKILTELAELAISEATLFPEIDNVAKYLKEQIKGMI
jgi:hypothetical protein